MLLAILCSASIALIFKHSESSGMNRYAVTTFNYATAVIISAAIIIGRGFDNLRLSMDDAVRAELLAALSEGRTVTTSEAGLLWAVIVGSCAGIVFFLAFIYYQISVRRYGAGMSGAFAKLGILVPMSLSLVLWREYPTTIQWLGMALAVGSIVLANRPGRGRIIPSIRVALLLLFLFGGLAEFSNKVFQNHGLQEQKAFFLLSVFAVALILSATTVLVRRQAVQRRDILTGVAVGIPNLFSSYFLILALDSFPATVAFPIFGAGTVLVINAVGISLFGERLSTNEKAAIVLTIAALILINL